jgi:hypothetical protein
MAFNLVKQGFLDLLNYRCSAGKWDRAATEMKKFIMGDTSG